MATVCPVKVVARMAAARADLGLSGEGLGLRGGGVRGTAGFGAMLAAGRKPWMMWLNWLRRFLRKLRSILAEGCGLRRLVLDWLEDSPAACTAPHSLAPADP